MGRRDDPGTRPGVIGDDHKRDRVAVVAFEANPGIEADGRGSGDEPLAGVHHDHPEIAQGRIGVVGFGHQDFIGEGHGRGAVAGVAPGLGIAHLLAGASLQRAGVNLIDDGADFSDAVATTQGFEQGEVAQQVVALGDRLAQSGLGGLQGAPVGDLGRQALEESQSPRLVRALVDEGHGQHLELAAVATLVDMAVEHIGHDRPVAAAHGQ
ncbi:hypothetical protein D3C86_1571520 [compost metagenome]